MGGMKTNTANDFLSVKIKNLIACTRVYLLFKSTQISWPVEKAFTIKDIHIPQPVQKSIHTIKKNQVGQCLAHNS